MPIEADSQTLNPGNLVTLYELDSTEIGGDQVYFHGHNDSASIFWQGKEYKHWPIHADGFDISGQAKQTAPTLRVGNVDGSIGALCLYLNDLLGAKITRRRTLSKYLDAVNFPEGNPQAATDQHYPDDIYYIEKKISHNRTVVEFELRSALELSDAFVPRRLIVANVCAWLSHGGYRGPHCGYTGPMYDKNDNPTSNPELDACAGYPSSCKRRFGENAELPYGGFPSATLARN